MNKGVFHCIMYNYRGTEITFKFNCSFSLTPKAMVRVFYLALIDEGIKPSEATNVEFSINGNPVCHSLNAETAHRIYATSRDSYGPSPQGVPACGR